MGLLGNFTSGLNQKKERETISVNKKLTFSTDRSWTCGVFLAGDFWQAHPTENYFVFPQQMKTECPVSALRERTEMNTVCKKLGKKWSAKWSATSVGRSGREGDKICKMVADNLNVTKFPSQIFPQGIMVRFDKQDFGLSPSFPAWLFLQFLWQHTVERYRVT